MKTIALLSSVAILLAGASICRAQQIDSSLSRTATLSPSDTPTATFATASRDKLKVSPLMTRAVAHRSAEGKVTVKCEVDHAGAPHSGHGTQTSEQTRKFK